MNKPFYRVTDNSISETINTYKTFELAIEAVREHNLQAYQIHFVPFDKSNTILIQWCDLRLLPDGQISKEHI